jgi:hypothetical protein
MVIQIILDVSMFKLAFHTYEILCNKQRLIDQQKINDP